MHLNEKRRIYGLISGAVRRSGKLLLHIAKSMFKVAQLLHATAPHFLLNPSPMLQPCKLELPVDNTHVICVLEETESHTKSRMTRMEERKVGERSRVTQLSPNFPNRLTDMRTSVHAIRDELIVTMVNFFVRCHIIFQTSRMQRLTLHPSLSLIVENIPFPWNSQPD